MIEEIQAIDVGDFRIETYLRPSLLGEAVRSEVLENLEEVSAQIWVGRPRNVYAARSDQIFGDGIYFHSISRADRTVGFAIRSILEFEGYHVLYRRLTIVLPECQGYGLDRAITQSDVERALRNSSHRVLLASRTRNPIVWFALAEHCSRVALDLMSGARNQELIDLGGRLALKLFPENVYEFATMTSKDVFFENARYSVAPRHKDPRRDAAFAQHPAMKTARDTTFFLGELRRPLSSSEQPKERVNV